MCSCGWAAEGPAVAAGQRLPAECRYVSYVTLLSTKATWRLRWARENGCPWIAQFRDRAAAELGYEGNLQSWPGGVGAPTCRPDMSAKTPCRRTCRPADSVGVSVDMSAFVRPTLATWSTSTAMINNQYSDECIRTH